MAAENIMQKLAKTINEQIALLEERGLIIPDKDKAREVLMDIGYYRLGFFAFPFEQTYPSLKNRSHRLREGVYFEDLLALYYFDSDLRDIVTHFLNRIEVNLRTYMTYTASIKYKDNPVWFVDSRYVLNSYIETFPSKVYKTIKESPTIKRHHKNYINDKYAPAWKTLEFMTLGNILSLYDSLKDNGLQKDIAAHYGCNIKTFKNYFNTIKFLRNRCAHGACIYNMNLPQGITSSGPAGKMEGEDRHNINGTIRVVEYILGKVSINRLKEMKGRLQDFLSLPYSDNVKDAIKKCSNLL